MNNAKFRFWFCLFSLILVLPLRADEPRAALIISYEGERFTVTGSDGSVRNKIALDMTLAEGDTVVTGEEAFLELQLLPSQNILKIAENSEARLRWNQSSRRAEIELIRGGLRARIVENPEWDLTVFTPQMSRVEEEDAALAMGAIIGIVMAILLLLSTLTHLASSIRFFF